MLAPDALGHGLLQPSPCAYCPWYLTPGLPGWPWGRADPDLGGPPQPCRRSCSALERKTIVADTCSGRTRLKVCVESLRSSRNNGKNFSGQYNCCFVE